MNARSFPAVSIPFVLVAFGACGGGEPTPPATPAPSGEAPSVAASKEPTPPPAAPAAALPKAPEAPKPVATWKDMMTPESVLYDEANDRYLVSNVNGKPLDKDGNGFISELSPDGTVKNLKWIESGKNKVTLNAPKGSVIVGDVFYVADIDRVRMFDLKSGAPKGEVAIAGATFLNDVAAGADGKIYVTDTGMKPGKTEPFEPAGTDAIYAIDKGKVKVLAKSKDLHGPNGILAGSKGLVFNTFGANEVSSLDEKNARKDLTKTPKGGLDGLVELPNGDLLVSSWEGSALYRGKLGGNFEAAISDLKAPADIGYDKKRGRVLVPHFLDNTVEAYELR